ncbi:MAG: DUF3427 domain-containing protein [Planctomycetota bacterium]|nr:DUF3427 domain-containing protein [Planctomycetota bacterium]
MRHTPWSREDLIPLVLHAHYTRDEALVGLGHWTLTSRPEFREGVLHLPTKRVDAFFATLQKEDRDYSESTRYSDYVESDTVFHWQSQSTTSEDSLTGQRYIYHQLKGYTPLLFVRDHKRDATGQAAPYCFLGPLRYLTHRGSKPMSIRWGLEHKIPARLTRALNPTMVA